MKNETAFVAFNRGLVSKLALARMDLKRLAFSAEVMENWMPRDLGSMMLRSGTEFLGSTDTNNQARFLPFIFSVDDTALIELTNVLMRVWVDEVPITRAAVSSAVTNGAFNTDLTGWTDNDEIGATSAWQTGGYMGLTGNGTASAVRDQQVTVAGGDLSVRHALRIVISRGPVTLRVGSTAGGDEYLAETVLETGYHSLAFTPTGNFHIRFRSVLKRIVLVDSCTVEAAGIMTIPAPWTTANLRRIRSDQSGDILFVACSGFLQRKIERRNADSWSLVWFLSDNGPFFNANTSDITLVGSATSGNITLTASRSLFNANHVACLFSLTPVGQRATAALSAQNTFTSAIQVNGIGEERRFAISLSGTWVATVTLQRSVGTIGSWVDVTSWTTNQGITFADALDNQIVFYRLGIKTGNYTSGSVIATLDYALGNITGVVRVTGYTSPTVVSAEVLTELGDTSITTDWREGMWSTNNGFPGSVAFYEGRLWWAGQNGIWGSVSDDFYNHDPLYEGDAGPINRTIGSGPVDDINWILPMQRLLVGAEGAEFSVRATSFDELLTPSNFNIKDASNQGSSSSIAVKIDSRGLYVQRNGTRLMELAFDLEAGDYRSVDLTAAVPEVGEPSILHVAVQRQPDTRVHCVRSDGKVAVLVYNTAEKVLCWLLVSTDGIVEDVVTLPGTIEDSVYYVVKRTINGVTKRYLELWALESEAHGGTGNFIADSFAIYSGAAATTITGLSHLEAKTVVVWGNGKDLGTKVVSGGQITGLSEAVTTATIGLAYTAQWKSTKLAFASDSILLTYPKRVFRMGIVLADTHAQGLQFGPDFTTMDGLPLYEDDSAVGTNTIHAAYDQEFIEFPGEWSNDARLCLKAAAPRPCTVLAAVLTFETGVKS
jgi:hypothetical protein